MDFSTAIEHTRLHFEVFFNGKGENVHMFVLTYDEEMPSPFSKHSKCEKTLKLKYIVPKINSWIFSGVIQQNTFEL